MAVGWVVVGSLGLMEWFAGVGPGEGVGHRLVVVVQELFELVFEVLDRTKVSPAYHLSHDDSEDRLDLVQP